MWALNGVANAIQQCQSRKSVLVILVEPPNAIMHSSTAPESSLNLVSRVAISSMHKFTFSNRAVTELIQNAQAECLRFPSEETNPDFKAFSVYFKLHATPPNLYFISPLTGQTLLHKSGFVSAEVFVKALVVATKTVSGRTLAVPQIQLSEYTKANANESAILNSCEEDDEEKEENEDHEETLTLAPDSKIPLQSKRESEKSNSTVVAPIPASSTSMKLSGATKAQPGAEAKLLARLPGGTQIKKTFPASAKFFAVRSWLSDELQCSPASITISTAFPRRVFDQGQDPKMLSELALVPSETLIVAFDGNTSAAGPSMRAAASASSGIRSYAAGALGIVTGFLRSFVADNPTHQEFPDEEESGNTRAGQMPSALDMRRARQRQPQFDDDENLLSNGNSTQYGWNPRDGEDSED